MPYHLVVLVHGLWGTVSHFEYVCSQIEQRYGKGDGEDKIIVYRTHSNEGYFTYDGIDVCGTRVADEIEQEIARIEQSGRVVENEQESGHDDQPEDKVSKISIVGYSLGGLMCRYAVGLLESRGLFERITPVTFTTFCTPHVGVRALGTGISLRLFNLVGPWSMSNTSRQLFLEDEFRNSKQKLPLLRHMVQPRSMFMAGLGRFQSRTLYANIINDHRTEFYTSAISTSDPFKGRVKNIEVSYIEGYEPTVIDLSKPIEVLTAKNEKISVGGSVIHRTFGNLVGKVLKWVEAFVRLAVLPLWFIAFILNASYQTVSSITRQKKFWNDNTSLNFSGLVEDNTELDQEPDNEVSIADRFQDRADDALTSVYEAVNYSGLEENTEKTPLLADTSSNDLLPLKSIQIEIISELNTLAWHKYPVHITLDKHSHAAVIVRYKNPRFKEGETIIKHWLDQEFRL